MASSSCLADESSMSLPAAAPSSAKAASSFIDSRPTIVVDERVHLEAEMAIPFGPVKPDVVFVITHPYGPLGGDMRNNVVSSMYFHLAETGHTVLRFNFRGVGRSTGRGTWRGNGEKDDCRAVIKYLLSDATETKPQFKRIIVIGYSYGAAMACSLGKEFPQIVGYVAISYPFAVLWLLSMFGASSLIDAAKINVPKLFLAGSADAFTSVERYESELARFPEPKQLQICQDANHFWGGFEPFLVKAVDDWIAAHFP